MFSKTSLFLFFLATSLTGCVEDGQYPQSAAPIANTLLPQTAQFCVGGGCTTTSEAIGVIRSDGDKFTYYECFKVVTTNGRTERRSYRRHRGEDC